MSIEVTIDSLMTPGPPEDRLIVNLNVTLNETNYKWFIFVPKEYIFKYNEYIELSKTKIEQDILAKEAEWQALEPKTRVIPDPLGLNDITVDIQKEEIVRPNNPDYYIKRREEYPPIAEQLDAFWKGSESEEYQAMVQTIHDIKEKYPKE